MFRLARRALQWLLVVLLIVGALGGSAAALLGPQRVSNVFRTAQRAALENIDSLIPDEVKLKNDLERLRDEYPRRISELKAMIDDLREELEAAAKEERLCREVVAMCDEDLGASHPARSDAPQRGSEASRSAPDAERSRPDLAAAGRGLRRGSSLALAYAEDVERGRRITDLRERYAVRLRTSSASGQVLRTERERLVAELVDLEQEYDGFIGQFQTLQREIDLLRHNEKLIELSRRRERVERVDTTGWLRSLADLKRAIARVRDEQEEKLRGLNSGSALRDYEAEARARAGLREALSPPFDPAAALPDGASGRPGDRPAPTDPTSSF